MTNSRTTAGSLSRPTRAASLLPLLLGLAAPAGHAQEDHPAPEVAAETCTVDLALPGMMKDIVSNALVLGLKHPEPAVRKFLEGAHARYRSGEALLKAAAAAFHLPEAELRAAVLEYVHCNCEHTGGGEASEGNAAPPPVEEAAEAVLVSRFAEDVTLHVVLHEIGHALVREFDLPVLANEETLADAFATHYLVTHLPERAAGALEARVRSLSIEADEVPRAEWPVHGEHDSDARRAWQIAALAVAADREKYRAVADAVGMSQEDIGRAVDFGAEIHRSWRRVLEPLWMPAGVPSGETRVTFGGAIAAQLEQSGLGEVLRAVLQRFDWHSRVTIAFVEGGGGAGWSRSKRTITVHDAYVRRFVRQGGTSTPERSADDERSEEGK